MIESIFEQWLTRVGQNMSAGQAISIERDKVPFGVETVDEIEKQKLDAKKIHLKRKKALNDALDKGHVCFLMYGGVSVGRDIMDKFVDGRLKIGNDQGKRRMLRIVKSVLSKDPHEDDFVFICIPAYVKLVKTLVAEESAEACEDATNNEEAMADPIMRRIIEEAKESLSDYEVELDTDYLDKLSGEALRLFVNENHDSIKEMEGYLFGGEFALKFVESMLGNQLVVMGDDGRAYQRDCFAHTSAKVAERLLYL